MSNPTPVEHLRPVTGPARVGQATAIEQSRAVAEVQAAVLVAQQCPRDPDLARAEMRRSCSEMGLALKAFYKLPRGGQIIEGPTIHLARELARVWGNVDYGIDELRRDDEHAQSEMRAYAWDQQTNSRASVKFVVPHMRDKQGGPVRLVDMAAIYENNANQGARRLREQIFAILPPQLVGEAERLCRETLAKGDGRPLAERADAAVDLFRELGVSVGRLEARIGRPRAQWLGADLADLAVVAQSLRARDVAVDEMFPPDRVTAEEIAASTAATSAARSGKAAKPKTAKPAPPAQAEEPPTPPAQPEEPPTPPAELAPAAEEPPAEPEPDADADANAEAEPVTLAQLVAAGQAAGRIDRRASINGARAPLLKVAEDRLGWRPGTVDDLIADQDQAAELLARLVAEAAEARDAAGS